MSSAAEAEALAVRQKALHQSTVKELTEGCQHKWKLRYVDGLDDPSGWDALVGTAAHHAIELHEQERIDARVERRPVSDAVCDSAGMESAAFAWLAENDAGRRKDYGDGRPYDLATARMATKAAIANWWLAVIPDGQPGAGGTLRDRLLEWEPVQVEPHFRVWTERLRKPLGGWIDGVYRKPDGTIVLVDQKTAFKYSRWPLDGTVGRLQPAQYALGALWSAGLPVHSLPVEFEFHISRTTTGSNSRFEAVRVISVTVDRHDVAWAVSRASDALEVIDSGVFVPNTGTPLCSERWCSFYASPACPATMPG